MHREKMRAAARLRAELHDAAVLLGRGDHRLPFEDVVAVGLLDVDVLAGLAGVDRRQGVPVVGRADDEGIERFVFQCLAKVLDGDRAACRSFPRPGAIRESQHGSIEIAHIANFDFRQRGERAQHAAAAPSTPIMQIEILSLAAYAFFDLDSG